ncbi:MAG TPA: MoxR family ATPase [Oligoflexia bacterium]|nr:MoxR family ATPase [Oligoflexia bacterium]HMP48964.1 MoxR family ATPase [Oligoflexia bacterium]
MTTVAVDTAVKAFNETFHALREEIGRAIVGQKDTIDLALSALFAGGHLLLEGSPGVGKTLLVRSLSQALSLEFHRIQFTSDLMPSDIAGTQILLEDEHGRKHFDFRKGPVFTQLLLADEINRAGPKTQSALLEAMEERQVTVLGTTHPLPRPFFVLATQNPIELEGTYPLPEAQLDRFLFKVLVKSPNANELKDILDRTTGDKAPEIRAVFKPDEAVGRIIAFQTLVRKVLVSSAIKDLLVSILFSLNPDNSLAPNRVRQYVRFAAGPRGAQAILLAAKVRALCNERMHVANEDIKSVLLPTLRHRLILQFQAEADGVSADDLIREVGKIQA